MLQARDKEAVYEQNHREHFYPVTLEAHRDEEGHTYKPITHNCTKKQLECGDMHLLFHEMDEHWIGVRLLK